LIFECKSNSAYSFLAHASGDTGSENSIFLGMSSQGLELCGTVVGLDLERIEAVADLLKSSIALDSAVGGAFALLLLLFL
jgi:hypothetical protein